MMACTLAYHGHRPVNIIKITLIQNNCIDCFHQIHHIVSCHKAYRRSVNHCKTIVPIITVEIHLHFGIIIIVQINRQADFFFL